MSDLWNTVKDIFKFLSDFFGNLLDFLIHIIIPTDEQFDEIKQDYVDMGDTLKSRIPFVSLFSDELKKAQDTVDKNDFLVITIPSFSYSSNNLIVSSSDQKVINVRDTYEPYREYVRGFLFLVVLGMAFVFIIKHFLNYSHSQTNGNIDKGDSSK